MSYINRSIAGLAGSLALTGVHQLFKKYCSGAPNLDQVGEKAVKDSLEKVDINDTDEDQVYAAAMGGNILSNALLFSTLATSTNTSQIITKTLGTGLLGAAGTMGLADQLLGNNKATNTDQKKWMTTGYYLFGAIVSIGVYNLLENRKKK
ncbi:hypothetical protein FNJ88_11475 [Chryseobacterium sp. SNU WT5]|uniref:hypothetical protein n=1 Tax=Chryseobacterium sp. SNU WT5 TaxID=2594269 RepID=UPI00117F7271|nr:hypothetical protein [Chryseobacterium sp. SNU WT5]QDP86137.1 hypothetical protein FNJ88_11475 [Chryseobacterium sp. SNU WT5]